jgi:hypothetical protein
MNIIAGGDWRFFYPENLSNFIGIPSGWDASLNTGVGMPALNTLWITGYLYFTSFLYKLGLSWDVIGLLCWIIPPIVVGFTSMFLLYKFIWKSDIKFAVLAGLIYITNTYFLMIFSGGQLGVSLAYSFVPLVILRFLKNVKTPNLYNSIFFGLVFSLQLLFDPRISLITCILLFAFMLSEKKKIFFSAVKYTICLPLLFVALVHSYWVLPIVLFYLGSSVGPSIYKASNDFSFYSFAKLENTISLLHPNWPENLFGRVHFMRPEFLIIPILAFIPLLLKKAKNEKKIIIVTLIALTGIFLAKGVNDPFGIAYILFLKYVPGFSMFRDPTKFYIPIALCFSLLIPIGLENLSIKLSKIKHIKKMSVSITFFIFFVFWIIILFPLFNGTIGGIFKLKSLPNEYINYKNFITQQPEFFRTLWIPQIQRFGYFSNNHPAIGRSEIFHDQTLKGLLKELAAHGMEQKLSELSVKYIVVPFDPYGEIFVDDGKFDKKQYDLVLKSIEKISYLSKYKSFGSIVIFKTREYKEHFSFARNPDSTGAIKILSSSPSYYRLSILPSSNDVLIFGDGFDKNWIMKTPTQTVSAKSYHGLNSFDISKTGSYNIEISYAPQNWVSILFLISVLTAFFGIFFLVFQSIKIK